MWGRATALEHEGKLILINLSDAAFNRRGVRGVYPVVRQGAYAGGCTAPVGKRQEVLQVMGWGG